MNLSAAFYKYFRAPKTGFVRVQLGPGKRNYLANWINVDANMFTAKCDVWANLENGLPFRDSTITAIYSHHTVEHLPDLTFHFQESYRCLKPEGIYRVGVPDGDMAIKKFIENDKSWFGDFPDKRESIGGRLENFIFCRHDHLSLLTLSYLEELMLNAGFVNIRACVSGKQTYYPNLFNECLSLEASSNVLARQTLVVEGEKPA